MVKIKCLSSLCGEYKTQIFAAIAANIISLAHGAALGWLSPMLLILQSTDSPLVSGPLSVSEASWLGSIFCFGGIGGNYLMGFIANAFGRKRALSFLAIPQITFWLMVIFGNHINILYTARVFAGLAGGGTFVTVPLFVSEIADKRIRGSLGSLLFLTVNIGILTGFVIGANLPYHLVPKVFVGIPAIFFFTIIFLPETPQFLLSKGDEEGAKRSLEFYKNIKPEGKENLEKFNGYFKELTDHINSSAAKTKLSLADFKEKENLKSIFFGLVVVSIYILGGGFAVVTYTANIFKQSGSDLNPNTSSIIVALNQILGTYVSTLTVDRLPRKLLLAISTCGSALGYIVTGAFSMFAETYDLSEVKWIPVASLSFAIFIGCVGYIPLTFVVLAELLPQKIRPIASSVCNSFLNLLAFGLLKVFPPLMLQIGLHGVMWAFAGVCLLGMAFIILFLPETKGKSI